MLAAKLYCEDRSDRLPVELSGTLRDEDWRPVDISVDDVSTTGARIRTEIALRVGEVVTVGIEGLGLCPARVVREVVPGEFGCAFVRPFSDYELGRALDRENVVAFPGNAVAPQIPRPIPEAPAAVDDRYPVGIRALIIAGAAVGTWAAIGGAAVVLLN